MPTSKEVIYALYGTYRLARFDAEIELVLVSTVVEVDAAGAQWRLD